MAFSTTPTARPTARAMVVARSAVPRKVQNAVASVMAAVPLILAPAGMATELPNQPIINYDSSVIMNDDRASQTVKEPDYNAALNNTGAEAQAALPDASSEKTEDFVEAAKKLFAGDIGEVDRKVDQIPTDVQNDNTELAARAEFDLAKAKTNPLKVTSDGPLSAATVNDEPKDAKATQDAKKLFGLF